MNEFVGKRYLCSSNSLSRMRYTLINASNAWKANLIALVKSQLILLGNVCYNLHSVYYLIVRRLGVYNKSRNPFDYCSQKKMCYF